MSSQNNREWTIRPAIKEDYQDVLEMSQGLYEGFDILPAMFFKYLQSPTYMVHVVETNGKVVALHIASICDDGRTFNGLGIRSHHDHKGAFKYLRNNVTKRIYPIFPGIKIARGSTASKEFASSSTVAHFQLTKRVMIRLATDRIYDDAIGAMSPSRTALCACHLPLESIIKTTKEDLKTMFGDSSCKRRVFPDNVFVRENEAFDLRASNVDKIVQYACALYTGKEKTGVVNSFSLGIPVECQRGLRYNIDYHGVGQSDIVLAHLVKHLAWVAKCCNDRLGRLAIILPAKSMSEKLHLDLRTFSSNILGFDLGNSPCLEQFVMGFSLKGYLDESKM